MDLTDFRWMNKAKIKMDGDTAVIEAHPCSDFFTDPATGQKKADAAYLYKTAAGDFTLRARVGHGFVSCYDACALMVMLDGDNFAKLCYELTDFGEKCIVSVVTKGLSDDANGVIAGGGGVWLQVARKGGAVMFHYSADGENWVMARHFAFDRGPVRAGLVAQSPKGGGGAFRFDGVVLENRAPSDMRAGK